MVTITEKDFLNRYQSPASNNLPFIILVANKGEEIIGVITIECAPTVVANEEKKLYPVLSNLIVRKDMRRKGVAKSLTRRAESIVRARRYKDVYLYVDVENKAALQLYKSRGYKVTSDINETTKIACNNKRFVNIKCANMLMRKKMLF
jgi:ribosomal protein S18 acetylase RimI-like enzyme